MSSAANDPALETLLLPLADGLLAWPAPGGSLFLRARTGSKGDAGIAVRQTPKTGPQPMLGRAPMPLPNTGDDFWTRTPDLPTLPASPRGGFVPPLHHGLYSDSSPTPSPAPSQWQNLSVDLVLEEERTPSSNQDEIQILEPVDVDVDAYED